MDKSCKTCFFDEAFVDSIVCGSCIRGGGDRLSPLHWVAVDFLKNVPDDEAGIEGDGVMSQMAEQLLQSKPQKPESALDKQVSGGHYKALKIQPIEFLHANNIPFAEGCAIKYLCRWRDKGGIKDLEKAKHFIELLIELEERVQ
jgi:hypothetical protein